MKRDQLEKLSKEQLINIIIGKKIRGRGKPGYGFASLAVGELKMFEVEPSSEVDPNGYLDARAKLIRAMNMYNYRNNTLLEVDKTKSDWHGVWIHRQK